MQGYIAIIHRYLTKQMLSTPVCQT